MMRLDKAIILIVTVYFVLSAIVGVLEMAL